MKRSGRQTWELHNFGGGLDLRDGIYSVDQNRFREFTNVHVTKGKRVRRRPPCIKVAGAFGANTWGLIQRDGVLYTFIPRGTVTGIGTPTGVTVLPFDPPPGSTAHAVTDLLALNDTLIALFQHTVGGVALYAMHVFDGKPDLPTYVTDPAFPWLHHSGPLPRAMFAIAANKVFLGGPRGDTYHSGVARPRTWWSRTLQDVLDIGYEHHFYLGATGSQTVTVHVDATLIGQLMSGFVAWVVERYTGTGVDPADYAIPANWGTRLTEVTGAPAAGQCQFGTTPNTSTGATYANWCQVTINASAVGWYRVRLLPPRGPVFPTFNYVVSGAINPDQNTYVAHVFKGDGVTKHFDLPADRFMYSADIGCYEVILDGVLKANPGDYTIVAGATARSARIAFAAAPADGAFGQAVMKVRPASVNNDIYVFPGVINTLGGQKKWSGGVVSWGGVFGTHYVLIALDANYNPTGLIIQQTVPTGKQLYESVFVARVTIPSVGPSAIATPVYNGGAYTNTIGITTPTLYLFRTTSIDERLFQQAKADAGATDTTIDAGFLPTSSHDSSGGYVTGLVGVKNRLLVMYKGGSQLWAIDEDGANDQLLDRSAVGTGTQPTCFGAEFAGSAVVPTVNGFRSFGLGSDLSDSIRDIGMGDPIEKLGLPLVAAAAAWPWMGQYVAAAMVDGELVLFAFDYSPKREAGIAAWSTWPCAGVTAVDYRSMIAIDDRLYFRSGADLYYFDASVYTSPTPSFRDTNDAPGAGNAYESKIRWHFNDFRRPGVQKRFLFLDLIQRGASTVGFAFVPYIEDLQLDAPTIPTSGSTVGKERLGLSITGDAIAPIITSTDETGWELERIELDYMYLAR